jgi:peroxiredoxin
LLAATLVLAFAVFVAASGPLEVGAKAIKTEHQMKSISGKMVSIASVKGAKGTLVIFSCNTCPWVVGWEERIAKIGNKAMEKGIGVLYINPNDPTVQAGDSFDAMKKRAAERGFKFDYAVDEGSKLAKAYGATRTPEVFLFDANDTLVYYGTIDDNMQDAAKVENHYLMDAVKALAGGQQIATKNTKALGCTIKWYKGAE